MHRLPRSITKIFAHTRKVFSKKITIISCACLAVIITLSGGIYGAYRAHRPQAITSTEIAQTQAKNTLAEKTDRSKTTDTKDAAKSNDEVMKNKASPSTSTQPTMHSNSARPAQNDQPPDNSYDNYVPPPDPKPQFRVVLRQPPSNNAFGFIIEMVDIINPNEIAEFQEPVVTWTSSGAPRCDNKIYYINSNTAFGFNCVMFSSATYGEWPVTFSVTAKNIYNQTATKSVRGMIIYHQNQGGYKNILNY